MGEDYDRMTATLMTLEGEFVQVADFARTLGEMESTVTKLYCMGEKQPAARKLYGSVIVRIVRDEWSDQLPSHIHIGD